MIKLMLKEVNELTFNEKMTMFKDYPDALEVDQVCEILGTSRKTLYGMIDKGYLTPVKVGRKYMFAKIKIVEFLLGE